SNPHFLVQPDGDRSSRANPCNSLLVSFHDSRMSLKGEASAKGKDSLTQFAFSFPTTKVCS
ncbi:hypothetical protein, partial [Nostoc sp. S13]|uniref:hypothetical protein n=1 Tax=Nostoc sp. S13 TaxID=3019266 RepID=UPI00260A90D6